MFFLLFFVIFNFLRFFNLSISFGNPVISFDEISNISNLLKFPNDLSNTPDNLLDEIINSTSDDNLYIQFGNSTNLLTDRLRVAKLFNSLNSSGSVDKLLLCN